MSLLSRLTGQRTASSAVTVVTGASALGQLSLAAAIPVVAHVYDAASVGGFAVYLAYCQIIAIVVSARLEQSLPRVAHSDRFAVLLLSVAPGSVLGISCIVAVQILTPGLDAVTASALAVISTVWYNASSQCALGFRRYRQVAAMRLVNGVATASLQILGGFIAPTAAMLLLTYAAGTILAALCGVVSILESWKRRALDRDRLRSEKLGLFAGSVGVSALLSNFSLSLPVIAFSAMFGNQTVGAFYFARKILMVPTQLIASSVNDVTYSLVARATPGELRPKVYGWLASLKKASLVATAVGLIAAPVAELLIPDRYPYLWQVIVLLCFPSATQLVGTSLANVLLALRAEKIRLLWNVRRIIGLASIFCVCAVASAPYLITVAIMASYLCVNYLSLLHLTIRRVEQSVESAA